MAGENIEKYLDLGWFHLILSIANQFCLIANFGNMGFMVFGGIKPKIICQGMSYSDNSELCQLVENGTCTNYTMEYTFYSIVAEWNLICAKRSISYDVTSIQMVGVLFGAAFFGQISDSFGRKWVLVSASVSLLFLGATSSLSPNWEVFMIFRFFIGISTGGCFTVWFVYFSEMVIQKHRIWLSSIFGFPIAYIIVAWIAYFCQDWRTLALAVNAVGLSGVLVLCFLLPESPRWLVQKSRVKEAEKAIGRIYFWNRRSICLDEVSATVEGQQAEKDGGTKSVEQYTFWHLFCTWSLARNTLTLAFAWFSISCVGFGILFNASKLAGSPYYNMTYYGALKCIAGLLVALLDATVRKCGRKIIHSVSVATMTSCLAAALVISLISTSNWSHQAVKYLNLVATGFTTPIWFMVYLMTAELYPTPIRNLANSFCSVCARIGAIMAPQILHLGDYWSPSTYLFYVVFLTVDLILFAVILPEIKGKPLPEKMPDVSERIGIFRKRKRQPTEEEEEESFMMS